MQFDPQAGARAEAAVEALAQAIAEGVGGTIVHSALRNLQVGDDHPQYAMWQGPETIQGLWDFQTIPRIQGETLAEYIEDVVGSSVFDFLQDTSSVVWTYHETAGELEANVPPEFVQDTVGAMLTDSSSIDLSYSDLAGTFTAAIIDEYVQDLVGAMLADSSSVDFTYSDVAGTFTAVVLPAGVDHNSLANLTAGDPHTQYPLVASAETVTGDWVFTPAGGALRVNGNFGVNIAPIVPFHGLRSGMNGLGAAATMIFETDARTIGDENLMALRMYNSSLASTNYAFIGARIDDPTAGSEDASLRFYTISGGAGPGVRAVLTAAAFQLTADNQELQIGASQDLRLFHDGTDSQIRNDTGALRILEGATEVGRFDTNGTAGNTRFMVYDVDNGTLERVSVGAADSGGTGFKVLRIPN